MTSPKKLIEVAMPIKEISAESVRDKSIRHGHISTLHLWWARRPLPVCRAVVFASLVPDPMDPNCPKAFQEAVDLLLKKGEDGDPYKPYDDIPYTAGIDRMEDNRRNRLLMFIGKFSDTYIRNEHQGKATPAKDQLSAFSLIKWDNKNDEKIINKARKLIWVSHNAHTGKKVTAVMEEFDASYSLIKDAERNLYTTPDRHLGGSDVIKKEAALQEAIENFLNHMPRVFDPFAGGGAIPLEAARLGCRSFGNDINPVAHIVQKGSLEFPQKYGKPITYSESEFKRLYGEESWKQLPQENLVKLNTKTNGIRLHNRLSFDADYFARKLLTAAEHKIGHLYPVDRNGNKPIAYYWARVGICSNPSCKAEVPLLRQFYLANTKSKQVYLKPRISGKEIQFEIKSGKCSEKGWMEKSLTCPCCKSTTSTNELKNQSIIGLLKQKLVAVIYDSDDGKDYRLPVTSEKRVSEIDKNLFNDRFIPNERMLEIPDLVSGRGWGIQYWNQMFSPRQLYALQTLVEELAVVKKELGIFDEEYKKAVVTYLGIWIDRIATRITSFGLWNTAAETLEHPFGRQAIPMVFDYPESNPFTSATGGATNQIEWITKYIESEANEFASICQNTSSGDKEQFPAKSIDSVVTDPPYYDAIAYADLSDFFYVWLKRTLSQDYLYNFNTPQTPKSEECTALKHHHDNNLDRAKFHFESKLTEIFSAIEHQTKDIVSIMFAHQSTEAWTTLCNSILDSKMNFTGSWAIDTERSAAGVKAKKAFLSSSVTVSAKPASRVGVGNYRDVKNAIDNKVGEEVEALYKLGFRGADLLTACFGQAAGEFGKYGRVEKADGSDVTVAELLETTKESAFNALIKGFTGDDFTKFYIGWLQLYGFTESEHNVAVKITQIGLTIDIQDLYKDNILFLNKTIVILGDYKKRNLANKSLGEKPNSHLIDQVHRAMLLYEGKNRNTLLSYIARVAHSPDSSFWRVITSLVEVLPAGSDDQKAALELLSNRDNLIRESREMQKGSGEQTKLEF